MKIAYKYLFGGEKRINDFALLLLRLLFGLGLAFGHGFAKWAAFDKLAQGFPDPIGIGSSASAALIVFAEAVCSLLVAIGFLTRLSAIPPIIGMSVAFFIFHHADPWGVKELAFLYLAGYSIILIFGAGSISIDNILKNKLLARWKDKK